MASKKAESKSNQGGDQKSAGQKPADAKGVGDRNALPFEPAKSRKQAEKKAAEKQVRQNPVVSEAAQQKAKAMLEPKSQGSSRTATLAQSAIPEAVSKRMIRRMALFCGIPSVLGMSTFIVSYFVISNDWFDLPNVMVLLTSAGFFGLGVLGLSYGVLSTSWDEDQPGTRLGWGEFTTNFGRMIQAWRAARNQSRS